MRGLIIALMLILPLSFVPMASAAVTAEVTASTLTPLTGVAFTITYTKSSEAGDGTQTGSVVLTYGGPESGQLVTKNYNVAEGVDAVLTWTGVFLWAPGEYNFTFNDSVTAGTEVDKTLIINAQPAYTPDWSKALVPGTGYSVARSGGQSLAVDANGNAFVAWNKQVTASSSIDAVISSYSPGGVLRWEGVTSSAPGVAINHPLLLYDNAGRIVAIQCHSQGGSITAMTSRAYSPGNGASVELTDYFTATPAVTIPGTSTCPATIRGDAVARDGNTVQVFTSWAWIDGSGFSRLYGMDENLKRVWLDTTGFPNAGTPTALSAHPDDAHIIHSTRVSSANFYASRNATTGALIQNGGSIGSSNTIGDIAAVTANAAVSLNINFSNCVGRKDMTVTDPNGNAIGCPLDVTRGDATLNDDFIPGSQGNPLRDSRLMLDGELRPTYCATLIDESSTYHPLLISNGATGGRLGGLALQSVEPGLFAGSGTIRNCLGIEDDRNGGFYVLYDATSTAIYLMHFTPNVAYSSPALETQSALDVPGGGSGGGIDPGAPNTDSPIGAAKQYFEDSWSISTDAASWLFSMFIIGSATVGVGGALGFSALGIAVGALLGVGVAWAFGYFPTWALLVMIFLIIAMAGRNLFGGGAGGDDSE